MRQSIGSWTVFTRLKAGSRFVSTWRVSAQMIPIRRIHRCSDAPEASWRARGAVARGSGRKFERLASEAARWANDNRERLASADPVIQEGLNDRAADNWGPLLAIADAAGGHWPDIARRTAVQLSGPDDTEAEGTRVQLLADIREIFDGAAQERLTSPEIIARLIAREDSPWSEVRTGKPITPPLLAKMLRQFRIRPKVYRSGAGTVRGYFRSDFEDAWNRYLAPVTTKQAMQTKCLDDNQTATPESDVARVSSQPLSHLDCFGVSGRLTSDDENPEEGGAIMDHDARLPGINGRGETPAASDLLRHPGLPAPAAPLVVSENKRRFDLGGMSRPLSSQYLSLLGAAHDGLDAFVQRVWRNNCQVRFESKLFRAGSDINRTVSMCDILWVHEIVGAGGRGSRHIASAVVSPKLARVFAFVDRVRVPKVDHELHPYLGVSPWFWIAHLTGWIFHSRNR
jgi:hypothetical protein